MTPRPAPSALCSDSWWPGARPRALTAALTLLCGCGLGSAGVAVGPGSTSSGQALTTYAASVVLVDFPAAMHCGQTAEVSVTMRNAGSATWSQAKDFKLGTVGDEDPFFAATRVYLPPEVQVPPGQNVTFAFTLTAPARPGPLLTDWQMVLEHVQWFGAVASRSIVVDCDGAPPEVPQPPPASGLVTLCSGVSADPTGQASATLALQQCVDATADGQVLELPPGTWRMTGQLRLDRPITVRTAGTANSAQGCLGGTLQCAVLQAAPDLMVSNGFLAISGNDVSLEHLVLDGNRDARLGSQAARTCAGGNNRVGFNATAAQCTGCRFLYSTSMRALCGSGFEWRGDGAAIWGSTFKDNGDNSQTMMWSDGLTLLQSDGAEVRNNEFLDNSDIGFISGGARFALLKDNVIRQTRQVAFGALMLDNFNGTTHGDFTGAQVTGNVIECVGGQCDYGAVVGPHAWYPSANIRGGTVAYNVVRGAKMGIVVSGAGTPDAPLELYANDVQGSPASATFRCGLTRPSGNLVISPDSVVDRHGETQGALVSAVTNCP